MKMENMEDSQEIAISYLKIESHHYKLWTLETYNTLVKDTLNCLKMLDKLMITDMYILNQYYISK